MRKTEELKERREREGRWERRNKRECVIGIDTLLSGGNLVISATFDPAV